MQLKPASHFSGPTRNTHQTTMHPPAIPSPPMSRSATIETVASEILDEIVQHMALADISRLGRCSKWLHSRLLAAMICSQENCVYGDIQPRRRDVNYRWATADGKDGPTALFVVVSWMAGNMQGDDDPTCVLASVYLYEDENITPERLHLIKFLQEECGADPSMEYYGSTAYDAALSTFAERGLRSEDASGATFRGFGGVLGLFAFRLNAEDAAASR
ncbi:hypothetical protein MAPG_09338 [Magnaporthiopsis poae ATCC 64411]|uniref:F-box domain-containing protein n=1 Tax=Magnaporthiopsis poae (strain ATCC 64411 / 73-15) TaxID=644358 RepID=A0A0C4E9P2_MAGP6|nr:hypothetical protein MAPG_09338 [Magnaporthiopsis poae ATCC 64411]